MKVGLIGKGYWGSIYVKTLGKMLMVDSVETYSYDYKNLLSRTDIDRIIIATPLETHFQIAKDCLLAQKHVLLEKTFTATPFESLSLLELACVNDKRLILLPGHVYLYHSGILKLKELIDNGELGEIESIFSKRMSTSNYTNSIWEMGVHDIYIFDYLLNRIQPEIKTVLGDNIHCYYNMLYDNINVYVENCSYYPGKIREIIINGTKKQAIFDDISIKLIDKETKEIQNIYFDTIFTPLEKQCHHFFNCIAGDDKLKVTAIDAYRTISVLKKITDKINENTKVSNL